MLPAMLHTIITPIFRWPYRIIRAPIRIILVAAGVRRRRAYSLPCAGLQESKVQAIVFTLRRAATSPEEEGIAREWLLAWQLAQVATSRLLHELDEVQSNLLFWNRRMQRGSHFWFMLLQQGPVGFCHRVRQLLSAATQGEEAVPLMSEAEMVERRALIFRLLRTALCEALARVQAAGALLYLRGSLSPSHPQPGGTGQAGGTAQAAGGAAQGPGSDAELVVVGSEEGTGSGGSNGGDEESLFDRAERAIQEAMEEIVQAFAQLQASAHAALDVPGAQPLTLAEESQGREAGLLSQAVQKVLGLHHLRRLFSREQLDGGGATWGAVAAAALPPVHEEGEGEEGGPSVLRVSTTRLGGTVCALRRAQRAVGLVGAQAQALPPLAPGAGMHAAVRGAATAGRRLRGARVVPLPCWLLMPSEFQQHWIRYTLFGMGVGYASLFVYKHTPLSGSRDLENWVKRGADSMKSVVEQHVARPLRQVKDELFNTFRRRPTIVSLDEFIADRDSLQRMLDDFKADIVRRRGSLPPLNNSTSQTATSIAPGTEPAADSNSSGGEGAGRSEASELVPAGSVPATELAPSPGLEGMVLVMRCYEEELKRPLRNLVNGELARSLLIQVQKMKVDTESAMLEMDQILRANELSISLVAAVPAFLIAGGALYSLGRWLAPTPPDARWEAVPCRLAMVDVMRAVEDLRACEEGAAAPGGVGAGGEEEAEGWYFYCLAVGYEEAAELFRRHRGLLLGGSARSEWPALREDLQKLAAPASAHQRQRVLERVMRAYSVFHQF